MSIYLDQKYLTLISNRLPLFKRKDDTLFNCRCILCGDSTKNKRKARGYFFSYKTEIRYKCHNCDVSMTFGTFLKQLDGTLHSQYLVEKYAEGAPLGQTLQVTELKFETPQFKAPEERLLDKILVRLDQCSEDNEAVEFCRQRKIPVSKLNRLYYIDNIKNIVQLNDKYKESIKGEEPRLAIPFYDENGQLTGVSCRALRGEALRYITVKIKDQVPLIFGLEHINKKDLVYVVEGPLDSLFLNNCIAVGSTSLEKVSFSNLDMDKVVLIYDNQPRNKEVCKIIERSIDQQRQVVIWPQTIQEKDINDMVLSGRNILQIVKDNTFQGLAAKAKFYAWKRC